jgi:hypothetical protein
MVSEKAMYWVAVAVLSLAGANGFVDDHAQWLAHLADRAIAMMEQTSETAARYATLANITRGDDGSGRTQIAVSRAQVRLACVQGALAGRQAETARLQAERIRAQVLEHGPGVVVHVPRKNRRTTGSSIGPLGLRIVTTED